MKKKYKFDEVLAINHLKAKDLGLKKVINEVGAFEMKVCHQGTVFEYLCRSIVFQQLSGKAASKIYQRFLSIFFKNAVRPEELLKLPLPILRSAGLSNAKCLALYDLAEKTVSKRIPNRRSLNYMSDSEIVECLSQVKGIGEWTVQMLLIFYLGRADVLPLKDLGVRKGYCKMRGFTDLPPSSRLQRAGLRWRPYRSVATWYLWRYLEV